MFAVLGYILSLVKRFNDKCLRSYTLRLFKAHGKRVYIGAGCKFTPSTISIGENVYIGSGCVFQSVHGEITIGNHVMFGPGVHIHGGDHITDRIGIYMDEAKKESGSDGTVTIEDDTWIGANAIILKGITIHTGAIVGAGSVITKDVPEYSIACGNPAKVIKERFTPEQLEEHKRLINLR